MSQTHHSSSRIAGWLDWAELGAGHTRRVLQAGSLTATDARKQFPSWYVNSQFALSAGSEGGERGTSKVNKKWRGRERTTHPDIQQDCGIHSTSSNWNLLLYQKRNLSGNDLSFLFPLQFFKTGEEAKEMANFRSHGVLCATHRWASNEAPFCTDTQNKYKIVLSHFFPFSVLRHFCVVPAPPQPWDISGRKTRKIKLKLATPGPKKQKISILRH